MNIKTKKAISKLLISAMFFTTAFGNMGSIKTFATDTANSRKIDVWDLGGVQTSGDLYNNVISTSTLDGLTTVTTGLFAGGKTDFGDLSIAKPDAKDRLYYYKEDGTAGANSAGTWASSKNNYSDGYSSGGTYYCNGTAGNTRRYLTLDNVVAGDKITIYGGTSNGNEAIHFVHVAAGGTTVTPDTSAPQDTALDFTTKAQKVDFVAQYSGSYQIYVTATHSGKPYFHRVVRTPGVKVSGVVNLNGNEISSDYSLTLSNQTTGDRMDVTVNADNTFDTVLPAGYSYTAVLKGTTGYKISDETKVVTTSTSDIADGISNISLDVMVNSLATISGSIIGFESSYDVSKLEIKLAPPQGSLASEVEVTVDKATMTYTAAVEASQQYTAVISGVNDYELIAGSSVNIDTNSTQDITVAKKSIYVATGKFINLSTTAQIQNITFTNVDDGYAYNGTVTDGGYSVSLRNGAYTINPVCNEQYGTSTHIVVNGENTTKDIKFSAIGVVVQPINRVPDLYVGDISKAPYNYATVKEALDIAAKMNPTSEEERITIHIAPGVYRAQLKITTPYITLVNSNPDKEVKITWYYGFGYEYYSAGADGFYNEDRAFDKYLKNHVSNGKWGGSVYLTSTAKEFKAENIVFENSFNKYITDEEIADGVTLSKNFPQSTSINVERKSYTDVTSRPATERAAAMIIEADNVEFNHCSFIGSQDTLYTGGVGTNNQYYKNCFIEGNTDYIFGDGNVVFDNCTLNFCGYSDQAMGGYITAAKDTAKYGYLFRNSTVTGNGKNMQAAGYFGRPWGSGAKVKFLDTNLENSSIITPQGWTEMSGAKPETANFAEYNTTYNGVKVDTASRRAAVLSDITSIASTNSYFEDWTPKYYVADSETAPTFKTVPFFTTNDDINTPYPGHIISLGYEFVSTDHNLNDSSLIQWYRVSQDGKEELIKTTTAYISKTYKITTADSGYYIKAVVIPEIVNGKVGIPMSIKLDNVVRAGSGTGGANDIPDGQRVNIYIAGDSTVKTYTAARQEAGWGEYLQKFFNSDKVNVVNNANGGRSTRNFINEGSLDKIASTIKEGDYLLIQFGHNDSANSTSYLLDRFVSVGVPDAKGVYPSTPAVKEATPASLSSYGAEYYAYTSGTFKWYLQQYIDVAKKVGATPILVTPVSRQYFNPDGTIKPHHDATDTTTGTVTSSNNAYVTAVKQLGEEQGVKVIDMFTATKDSFETSYKNDPAASNGVSPLAKAVMNTGDSTHNNKIGGLYDGALMAKEIKKMGYNISNNIILPTRIGGLDSYNNLLFEVDSNSKVSIYTANSSGAYTNQLDSYWTSKSQELINSLTEKQSFEWKFTEFGASTSVANNTVAVDDTNKTITVTAGLQDGSKTGGKITGSQDGISYYYTEMDPSKNFEISADIKVNYFAKATPDNQEGFGIMARDAIGNNGDSSVSASNIVMVGGYRGLVQSVFRNNVIDSTGKGATMEDVFKFGDRPANDGTATYKMTMKKTNTGYQVSVDNGTEKIYYRPKQLEVLNSDKIYVGFFAARVASITVSNVSMSTSDVATDSAGLPEPPKSVAPAVKVTSRSVSSSVDYDLKVTPNVNGNLQVKLAEAELYNGAVEAGKEIVVKSTLTLGDNKFDMILTPGSTENVISLDPVAVSKTVTYKTYGVIGGAIYASQTGTVTGTGTENDPIDIYSAINFSSEGQTIYVRGGVYNLTAPLIIERGNNGTVDKTKVLTAYGNERPVFDFGKVSQGFALAGDYWRIYGIDVTKASSTGFKVSGNNNVVELVSTYANGDTGLQISGSSTDSRSIWPANNLIKNCTSYDNRDASENNADGFAAKLQVGPGNKFTGCIAHNNTDDGWDLYSKLETGAIEPVIIENSVAYGNGILSDGTMTKGDGNGFKLGGEGLAVPHVLRNSSSFNNKSNGVTNNSDPAIIVENVKSVDNGKANFEFHYYTNATVTAMAKNNISFRTTTGVADDMPNLAGEDNYFYNGTASVNASGKQILASDFKLLDENAAKAVDAENKKYVIGLVEEALKQKNFCYFNRAYGQILKLQSQDDQKLLLGRLSTISNVVWNAEIGYIVEELGKLSSTGSGQIYDEIQGKIAATSLNELDKGYFMGEVASWGKKLVWTKDYIDGVDSVVEVWKKATTDNISKAETAISKVKNEHSKKYLTDELKKAIDKNNK